MTQRKTVESFGPEMLDLFNAAAERPIELILDTYARAVYMRQRIYACRSAMRAEGHFLLAKAERVVIPNPVRRGENEWLLVPQPDGSFIRDALARAGVIPLSEQQADAPGLDDPRPSVESAVDEYLKGA